MIIISSGRCNDRKKAFIIPPPRKSACIFPPPLFLVTLHASIQSRVHYSHVRSLFFAAEASKVISKTTFMTREKRRKKIPSSAFLCSLLNEFFASSCKNCAEIRMKKVVFCAPFFAKAQIKCSFLFLSFCVPAFRPISRLPSLWSNAKEDSESDYRREQLPN